MSKIQLNLFVATIERISGKPDIHLEIEKMEYLDLIQKKIAFEILIFLGPFLFKKI